MRLTESNVMLLAAIAALTLLAGCETSGRTALDESAAQEGLVPLKSKTIDAIYRRPDATLAGYDKLLLRPIEVQFAKNWDPDSTSALYQMHEPDREKIRTELAQLFADVFKQELQKGGYPIVDTTAPDVLEMRAAIVNLYINAPDVSMDTPGRTRVYTTETGEMTLILELHDSVTGQLLARAYDRRAGAQGGSWTWTTSVTNSADARRIISTWATQLRKAFDASRVAQS